MLLAVKFMFKAGGLNDHNFLSTGVDPNMNDLFGILTSNAIDWYINESILRGSGGGGSGGFKKVWVVLQDFTGPLSRNIKCIFGILKLKPSRLAPFLGDLIKMGGLGAWCLVIEMHGMPPSRPQGCVQANYQQSIPNLQFTHCIMLKLHEVKKGFGKGFGWICALNRRPVQERAHVSFCPITLQELI